MTRLNQTKRAKILENALQHSGINSRKEKLLQRRKDLAYAVYLHALGGPKKLEEIKALYEKVKENLTIPTILENYTTQNVYLRPKSDSSVYAAFGGRQVNLQYNGFPTSACEHDERVYLNFWYSNSSNRQLFSADHEFSLEFDEIEKEAKAIQDIEIATRAEVNAITNSVTTINKLIKIWPEVVELLPPEEVETGTALQVNVANLNTLLNLPTEKEKGA